MAYKDKEKKKEYDRNYRKNNREKCREYSKRWRDKNPEYTKKYRDEYKKKYPEKRKQQGLKYYYKNKKKYADYQRKWRIENREIYLQKRKDYRKNNYNKDKESLWNKNSYIKNKVKRLAANKLWKIKNREKSNYLKLEYKRRKRGATGKHTLKEWQELKKEYNYICLRCKKYEPEITLTEDHIVPISKWKKWIKKHPNTIYKCDDIENIQPLCKSCNSIKHTKIKNYANTNTSFARTSWANIHTIYRS